MLQEERDSVHADFMTILMTILCRFLGCLGMNILVIYITNIFMPKHPKNRHKIVIKIVIKSA